MDEGGFSHNVLLLQVSKVEDSFFFFDYYLSLCLHSTLFSSFLSSSFPYSHPPLLIHV